MKKIKRLVAAGFVAVILTTGCNQASKKDMNDAATNIKEANANVKEAMVTANDSAKANAIANWQIFKSESDSAIAAMETKAAAIDAKITAATGKEKEKLKTDLNNTNAKLHALKLKLQERNMAFKNDLKVFDATVVMKNQSFEREFSHDMNELGSAFKDLFKDNVK